MNTIKEYAIHVYWDERAGYFVAEIPDIPTCAADGATQAEALANLEGTFAILKEAYVEERKTMPEPDPSDLISVEKLVEISSLVKISRLAELAGIPGQTLAAKLKRQTPLTLTEARRISRALREYGIAMNGREPAKRSGSKNQGSRIKTSAKA